MIADKTWHQDDGTGTKYDLPPPTKEGAVALPSPSDTNKTGANGKPVDDDARWDRVGWAPRFGQGDQGEDDGTTMLDHQTWIEGKLDDKFYGGRRSQSVQGGTS